MITEQTRRNAHKIAFLLEQYPDHNIDKIMSLLQMPPIDINAGVWAAVELKLISEPDLKKGGAVQLLNKPKKWDFGPNITDLCTNIIYCFNKLALKEQDLEENYLTNWLGGYSSQDTLIAIKLLISEQKLAEYEIEDGENAYTFFTLWDNREQLWGRKQFKVDPLEPRKRGKKTE